MAQAVKDLNGRNIDVLVTAPINKETVQSKHFSFIGHTDYLNENIEGSSVMMMVSDSLRVALLTEHLSLSKVTDFITKKLVDSRTKSIHKTLQLDFNIPESLNKAIELSIGNNPDLLISKLEHEQSQQDVKIALAEFSPTAKISAESTQSNDLSSTVDERDQETLKAEVSWPLFKGGKNSASLERSKRLNNRKKLLLDNALRTNETNVATAWSSFLSSASALTSVRSQVNAAEIANEGITVEYETGLGRTTLDVIQSNTILLTSRINLANSERNLFLSELELLKSVGLLNAKYLKIVK